MTYNQHKIITYVVLMTLHVQKKKSLGMDFVNE